MAGCARAVRAMGDGEHVAPALADRRDVSSGLEEIAGLRRWAGISIGGIGLFDLCRAKQRAAGARKRGLSVRPDDFARPRGKAGRPRDRPDARRFDDHDSSRGVAASFHVLAVVITAAQRGGRPGVRRGHGKHSGGPVGRGRPRTRLRRVLAGRTYSSRQICEYLRRRQIPHTTPEKRGQACHRLRRDSDGGRPPTLTATPAVHGWPDQKWTLEQIKTVIRRRFHMS